MKQLGLIEIQKLETESNEASDEELKDEFCDDVEEQIKKNKLDSSTMSSKLTEMVKCEQPVKEKKSEHEIIKDDDSMNRDSDNEKMILRNNSNSARQNSYMGDESAKSESSSNHGENQQQFNGAASAILSQSMLQHGQLSMQTFQNSLAQFSTNSTTSENMDSDTVANNMAMLQSALFTMQQQQFLQFQLIQHLQSQLVNQNSDDVNHKSDSDDEAADNSDASEKKQTNKIKHKRLMEDKPLTKTPIINKDSDYRLDKQKSLNDNKDDELSKAEEKLNSYTNNFMLSSNIITDHDPTINETHNSLAMLEMKAQESLNSASQGILSNSLIDEIAFANDKSSPNGRTDSSLFKHRCRYCGKTSGSDSSLQTHIRSHTGERPYKCNICGSRFTTKGNLKVHFERHSDKYPHIPMNPNPVPMHLDKYFPPLVPSEALKEMPNTPPPGALGTQPFPNPENRQFPQRGFFPDFYLPRPPMDAFNSIPKNELSNHERTQSPGFPMSPEVIIHEEELPKHTIKKEPEEETLDLSDKSNKTPIVNIIPKPKRKQQTSQPIRNSSPNIVQTSLIRQEREIEKKDDSINTERALRSRIDREREHRERERERDEKEFSQRHKQNSAENLSKIPSVSPPSSSSSTSGSLYQDTVLDPSYFSAHLPRPDSNDSSWENYIEISTENFKLQELVDNIDNKNIEPNQCFICKKVLSCRSALQMHYRIHTGERPFRCKICGHSFTTKGNLKTHMSVHRIKPPMRTLHQCPLCHQKFSNIFVLQQHIRLHTGEMTDLTPDQIRAAEIRDFPEIKNGMRMPDLNAHKRIEEHSDEENDVDMADESNEHRAFEEARSSNNKHITEGIRVKTGLTSIINKNQVKDLRSRRYSASNDDMSRDSSPISPSISEAKRLRSSSPVNQTPPLSLARRSPIATPPADRPPFPYAHPFLGMPQFPPFINRPPFMNNVSMGPSTANMPPFGLFGVRGNTTTCNICFKTFACNSALDIHYRSHTKERPFKCTICDRGFSTKGNMKQHILSHKMRDMCNNSNSGEESHNHFNSEHPSNVRKYSTSELSELESTSA